MLRDALELLSVQKKVRWPELLDKIRALDAGCSIPHPSSVHIAPARSPSDIVSPTCGSFGFHREKKTRHQRKYAVMRD